MHDNNMPSPLREFSNYMTVIKGRSPKTVEQYCIDMTLLFRYLIASRNGLPTSGDEFDSIDISGVDVAYCESVTREEVYEFLHFAAAERQNQSRSRARKLSSMKSFYKYMTTVQRYFEENPVKDVDAPPVKPALPKFLSLEESVALLDAVRGDTESDSRERDFAIITLFLNCGMRVSELAAINLSDVDRELRSARILGKGSKERIVYFNDACRSALAEYLKVRAADKEIKDKNAVFLSRLHKRISVKTVQWMVYKYLDMAGLGHKKCSVHKLRHTAATLMYQTGEVDVRVLKDILG
nr:tyrosine-type recombinase/integrase [Clostridia bacterium]